MFRILSLKNRFKFWQKHLQVQHGFLFFFCHAAVVVAFLVCFNLESPPSLLCDKCTKIKHT